MFTLYNDEGLQNIEIKFRLQIQKAQNHNLNQLTKQNQKEQSKHKMTKNQSWLITMNK